MAIPTYDKLMLPLLNLISDKKIYNLKTCEKELAKQLELTDADLNKTLKSGKKVFYDRISWAKTYLEKSGLLKNIERGKFKITEEGMKLLQEKPKNIDKKLLLNYESFKEFYQGSNNSKNRNDNTQTKNKTPQELIEEAYLEFRSSLVEDLLSYLYKVSFDKFEKIVLDVLVKMGYGGNFENAKRNTKKTRDGGIDGIINEDRLGLDKIYIQAKKWDKNQIVGRPEIQKFSGALDTPGANKGIFITTSSFTKDAIDYVRGLNNKKIVLIDGELFANLMIDFNVGVYVQSSFEIKKIDTDYFEEE
ncbi:restriction system protein [Marinitoga hydrogenitolerans DSM 16785]|uniref:Restriction system protein n=1 Tax=Marinitoga hydrogenitolerans (strain DSM 16785 / JCM 12826 / AT1271) TaxID=1122195 RepID=A0A1M4SQJ9_MARH1|nr:restriction endonuclease [Marinitoga hydrogenitolerans]SHE34490.1 restriction system protein [Marinitoga hydrogenitolerans DSM 16785]